MDNKTIERYIREAKSEDLMSSHSVEKHAFAALIGGMIAKLLDKKGTEAQRQLAALQRMERFMEKMTLRNVVFHFQAKMLTEQDRQIILLEQEKQELIKEIDNVKKRIE